MSVLTSRRSSNNNSSSSSIILVLDDALSDFSCGKCGSVNTVWSKKKEELDLAIEQYKEYVQREECRLKEVRTELFKEMEAQEKRLQMIKMTNDQQMRNMMERNNNHSKRGNTCFNCFGFLYCSLFVSYYCT